MLLELHEMVEAARGSGTLRRIRGTVGRGLVSLHRTYSSPEGMDANQVLMEDEANFIDFASSSRKFFTEEHSFAGE